MRIMVCVKQVIDVRASLIVDRRTSIVTAPGTSPVINRADICAIEAAMGVKENIKTAEVLAMNVGPPITDKTIRYCLARGVDIVWRIWDESVALGDPYIIAEIIAEAAKVSHCSLLLCGMASEDSQSAIVPALIAEKLGWPWVSRVVNIKLAENFTGVTVLQRGKRGSRLEISCCLPSVLAFYPALSGHQYVSVRRLRAAENKPYQTYSLTQLGLQSHEVISYKSPIKVIKVRQPKPRTKRTAIASQQLSGEDLMWQMISGTSAKKENDNLVRGEPIMLAERILEFLSEKGIFHQTKGFHKRAI
jgi:electron transfer flavoprotein beta subunit